MGQILNRLINFAKSELNKKSLNDSEINSLLLNDEDELKRIIEQLNSENTKKNKTQEYDFNKMNFNKALEILELTANFSQNDLKSAYKKKMTEYHPDKVENLGKEIQNLAQIKTQQINEAYQFIKNSKDWKNEI